jgi:RNA ligase
MITYKQIKLYIKKGLISEQIHPENNKIHIFNYTQKTQFENRWNNSTKNCRGLIMNIETNEIIARPFKKFFNYKEHIKKKGSYIPKENPIIMNKIDGSLIIHSKINDKDCLSTRGSFVSDQAIWAMNWWKENIKENIYKKGWTHLFEVVYPQNRIVVKYDFSGLVYLGSVNIKTGKTFFFDMPKPIRVVEKIENTDLSKLLEMDIPNSEGFVVYYPISNLRLKIKFNEYCRLHRIVTGISELAIWEYLKSGKNIIELVDGLPDEFFNWVKKISEKLYKKYDKINLESTEIVNKVKKLPTRKEQALEIMKYKYSGVCFKKLDNANYSKVIWKIIRPKIINKSICQN